MIRPRASRRISSAVTTRSSSGSWPSLARMPASTWSGCSAGWKASRQITKTWPKRLSYAACAALSARCAECGAAWCSPGETSAASASARSAGARSYPASSAAARSASRSGYGRWAASRCAQRGLPQQPSRAASAAAVGAVLNRSRPTGRTPAWAAARPQFWTGTAGRPARRCGGSGRPAWDSLGLDSVGLLETSAPLCAWCGAWGSVPGRCRVKGETNVPQRYRDRATAIRRMREYHP